MNKLPLRIMLPILTLAIAVVCGPAIARADCGISAANARQAYLAHIEKTQPPTLANILTVQSFGGFNIGPREQAMEVTMPSECPEDTGDAIKRFAVRSIALQVYQSALHIQGFPALEAQVRSNAKGFPAACLPVVRAKAREQIASAWARTVDPEGSIGFTPFNAGPFLRSDPLILHAQALLRAEAARYAVTLPRSLTTHGVAVYTHPYDLAARSAVAHLPDNIQFACQWATYP